MTDDEVLKLARDCCIHVPTVIQACVTNKDELVAFAAAVERATLERAALVCDNLNEELGWEVTAFNCALAIRALATHGKDTTK